jgi:hypothetical protein
MKFEVKYMKSSVLIDRLYNNLEIFKSLTNNLIDEQYKWKQKPDKWSILEVIHHLYDEEKEDFRLRIEYTLKNPSKEWIPINPPQWVIDRKYNNQNFKEISNNFFAEREKSVKWLKSLKSPDWNNIFEHPQFGEISAGDLLSSWVAHDFLHIRQISLINIEYYKIKSLPFNTKYAIP